MAALFDSAIDNAFFAALEAAAADAAVALLAAAAALEDASRLLTWVSRSAIRASRGFRSVQPAVITRKAKIKAFAMSIARSIVLKVD